MYYTLRINSMEWNMRYLFGFLVPFPFPSPVWKTGIICFLSRRSMTCIENFNIPHTQGQPLPPVIRTFDNLHIQIPFPMGQKLCLNASPIFFVLKVKSALWLVKFSAQPHTTLCIQFLDRENNDKTIHCPWENRFVLQWYGAVRKFTFL